MTTNTPISVGTAADILSYIPHVLGFQPQESLVFLTMAGKRVGATLRLDLPTDHADPLDYAQSVREYLSADTSADGVLMILYTNRQWAEPEDPPYASLVHCLDLVLDAAGLALLDGWLVSAEHWRDYFCDDATCCPWPGHPLQAITESLLNAELVYQGSSYAESLEAAMETPVPSDRKDVARSVTEFSARWAGKWDNTNLGLDALVLWDSLIQAQLPDDVSDDPDVLGLALAGLTCGAVRDSVIVLAAAGLQAATRAAEESNVLRRAGMPVELPAACALRKVEHQHGTLPAPSGITGAGRLFSEVFLATTPAPDWKRLDAVHALFSRLSSVATGEPRAALLSMLGWLEWARGRGSRAHRYLQEALTETPGYRLAELLLQLIGTGSLAEWARRRETAWTSENRQVA